MSVQTVDWPAGTERMAVTSPAFSTSYPRILRAEAISDESRFILDPIWKASSLPASAVGIFRLKEAYIAGEGLVFDEALNVIGDVITQQPEDQIALARTSLEAAIAAGSLVERDGPQVLCIKPGQANYGHWLVEMLPMADVAMRAFASEPLSVLVPDVQGRIRDVIADSLALLGVPADRISPALGPPERVRDLIVVTGLTDHGAFMSPLVFRTLDTLASGIAPLAGHERIYVRRRVPSYRRLVDDDALSERLAGLGYAVMCPEDHRLAHQIAAFKGSRQVFGAASAALTNIAFCRPGTQVAIFYPEVMRDTFYWFIAQHRRLDYLDVRCEMVGPSKTHFPHDTDLKVDPRVIAQLIARGWATMGWWTSVWGRLVYRLRKLRTGIGARHPTA